MLTGQEERNDSCVMPEATVSDVDGVPPGSRDVPVVGLEIQV